jgi:NADH:ubiquinone oxidoreductase subunit 6 (subunit J)
MTAVQLGFGLLAAFTIAGALGAVTLRNVAHAVLALVAFFVGVAAMFFMLRADFVGAVQILVYVGAVAVLIVFSIVLTRTPSTDAAHPSGGAPTLDAVIGRGARAAGIMAAGAVGALLVFVLVRTPAAAFPGGGLEASARAVDSTRALGDALTSTYALPFEVASVLLTAALVGAIVIAIEEIASR